MTYTSRKGNLSIRSASLSDIPQIIQLISDFEFPISEPHFRWKYLNCPWNSLSVVTEHEGRIVGHLGYVIKPFFTKGKMTYFAMAGDLYVRKSLRRSGIYSKMSSFGRKKLLKKEVSFTYGFPNEESLPASMSVRAESIGYVPVHIKVLRFKNILQYRKELFLLRPLRKWLDLLIRVRPFNRISEVDITAVNRFPETVDTLWNEVVLSTPAGYTHIGLRNKKFLDWRFCHYPDKAYTYYIASNEKGLLTGYMVLLTVEIFGIKRGVIVDIFHSHNDISTSSALVHQAINHFDKMNADLIMMLSTGVPGSLSRVIKKSGFHPLRRLLVKRPWPIVFRDTKGNGFSSVPFRQRDWFLTWADSDSY